MKYSLSSQDFPRAQTIFHRISLLSSQYRFNVPLDCLGSDRHVPDRGPCPDRQHHRLLRRIPLHAPLLSAPLSLFCSSEDISVTAPLRLPSLLEKEQTVPCFSAARSSKEAASASLLCICEISAILPFLCFCTNTRKK